MASTVLLQHQAAVSIERRHMGVQFWGEPEFTTFFMTVAKLFWRGKIVGGSSAKRIQTAACFLYFFVRKEKQY